MRDELSQALEQVIFRRVIEKKVYGYTSEMAAELAEVAIKFHADSTARLRAAARRVYDGLNDRLDDAAQTGAPHPVFVGIADLCAALQADARLNLD